MMGKASMMNSFIKTNNSNSFMRLLMLTLLLLLLGVSVHATRTTNYFPSYDPLPSVVYEITDSTSLSNHLTTEPVISDSFGSVTSIRSFQSALTVRDLKTIISSTRRYDTLYKKWESFSWSPIQRENLITSWMTRNKIVNAKRIGDAELYYNKEVNTK